MKVGANLFYSDWRSWISILMLGAFLAGCQFVRPDEESIYAADGRVHKKLFFKADQNGNLAVPRTFNCGWSANDLVALGNYFTIKDYNMAGHCNVQFEQTEKKLIGRLVNPSFPEDSNRWLVKFEIPIVSHFHLEKEKDNRGRETNRQIENSRRSHWSARPYMNLDLAGLQVYGNGTRVAWPLVNTHAFDIEIDYEAGFLGFTTTARAAGGNVGMEIPAQMDMRWNFLEFEHDPTFDKTYYSEKNAQFINVLHVLGKTIEASNPVFYAAKWDTSTDHTVYLHGFPEKYVDIGEKIIAEWNEAFAEAGIIAKGRQLFKPAISQRKYSFDLRYPTISWIDDKDYSRFGPLGVGQVHSDVLNGKVLWGGVTIWGGMIDRLINAYSPSSASSQDAAMMERMYPPIQMGLMEPPEFAKGVQSMFPSELMNPSMNFQAIYQNTARAYMGEVEAIQNLMHSFNNLSSSDQAAVSQLVSEELESEDSVLAEAGITPNSHLDDVITALNTIQNATLESLKTSARELEQVLADYRQFGNSVAFNSQLHSSDYIQQLLGLPTLSESYARIQTLENAELGASTLPPVGHGPFPRTEMIRHLQEKALGMSASSMTLHDLDRTMEHSLHAIQAAFSENPTLNKEGATRAFVKDLLLHEFGHMVGLGHNFKENILPEKGTLPNEIYEGLEFRAKTNQTNYTTVMGYKNGLTDIITKEEDLAPGIMDKMVLRYIYKKQFPVYPVDSDGSHDFAFVQLPADGEIPSGTLTVNYPGLGSKEVRAAYLPACNDWEASLGLDPFCNRWDRGYDAISIVSGYFQDYEAGLLSSLFALSDSVDRGVYQYVERVLWARSINAFSRTRLFYDYMRLKYNDQLRELSKQGGTENGIKNLIDFSDTCQAVQNAIDNGNASEFNSASALESFFLKPEHKELRELCVAVKISMDKLNTMVQTPGPDYTKVDYFKRYLPSSVQGGDPSAFSGKFSYMRAWGTWRELSVLPIKVSAALTLTAPYSFINFAGFLMPSFIYSRGGDGSFHMSTLYPKEYSAAVASAVDRNLVFGTSETQESTHLGRIVLSLGYFLRFIHHSNDILHFPEPYIQNIRSQTSYQYNLVAVTVTKKKEPDNEEIARKFEATIRDFMRGTTETVPEVYVYTNDRTIIVPPSKSLMLPLTSIRWITDDAGLYYAIKMDYSDSYFDRLRSSSVRTSLEDLYRSVMIRCVEGENNNGLRFFFGDAASTEVFPGFDFPKGMYRQPELLPQFYQSVERQFNRYYQNTADFNPRPDPVVCDEALRGQGLLVMAASAVNGFYFPELFNYIQKGSN